MDNIYERLIENLKKVIPEVDESKITMETRLTEDLKISSLSMMFLALNIENEFGIMFSMSKPPATVADVYNYIVNATK